MGLHNNSLFDLQPQMLQIFKNRWVNPYLQKKKKEKKYPETKTKPQPNHRFLVVWVWIN